MCGITASPLDRYTRRHPTSLFLREHGVIAIGYRCGQIPLLARPQHPPSTSNELAPQSAMSTSPDATTPFPRNTQWQNAPEQKSPSPSPRDRRRACQPSWRCAVAACLSGACAPAPANQRALAGGRRQAFGRYGPCYLRICRIGNLESEWGQTCLTRFFGEGGAGTGTESLRIYYPAVHAPGIR